MADSPPDHTIDVFYMPPRYEDGSGFWLIAGRADAKVSIIIHGPETEPMRQACDAVVKALNAAFTVSAQTSTSPTE